MTEALLHISSLVISVLTLAGIVFKAGRWSEKVERAEENAQKARHDVRNLENVLPSKFVSKEVYERDIRELAANIRAIQETMDTVRSQQSQILVAFGKVGGSLV